MSVSRSPRSAYVAVASAATLWGTWSVFLRPSNVDARWVASIVFAVMILGGLPLLLRSGQPGTRPRAAWLWMVVLGVGDAMNALTFFGAMQTTTVPIAVLSHYLAPLIVPIMAPWMIGSPRQRGAVARAALGALGLLLVLSPWRTQSNAGQPLLGAALGATSAVFYAVNVCATKRAATWFRPAEQLVFHAVVSLLIVAPLLFQARLPTAGGASLVVTAALLIGVSGAMLFTWGVERIPAEHASLLTFLEPLVAVLVGSLIFNARMWPEAAAGALAIVGAGVLAARADQRGTPTDFRRSDR